MRIAWINAATAKQSADRPTSQSFPCRFEVSVRLILILCSTTQDPGLTLVTLGFFLDGDSNKFLKRKASLKETCCLLLPLLIAPTSHFSSDILRSSHFATVHSYSLHSILSLSALLQTRFKSSQDLNKSPQVTLRFQPCLTVAATAAAMATARAVAVVDMVADHTVAEGQ